MFTPKKTSEKYEAGDQEFAKWNNLQLETAQRILALNKGLNGTDVQEAKRATAQLFMHSKTFTKFAFYYIKLMKLSKDYPKNKNIKRHYNFIRNELFLLQTGDLVPLSYLNGSMSEKFLKQLHAGKTNLNNLRGAVLEGTKRYTGYSKLQGEINKRWKTKKKHANTVGGLFIKKRGKETKGRQTKGKQTKGRQTKGKQTKGKQTKKYY